MTGLKRNYKRVFSLLLISVLLSSPAYAVLKNVEYYVKRIDIMKSTVVIWFDVPVANMVDLPAGCSNYAALSCNVGEKFCDFVVSTALAAKLADKQVEFTYSGMCHSNFAEVGRFRMME